MKQTKRSNECEHSSNDDSIIETHDFYPLPSINIDLLHSVNNHRKKNQSYNINIIDLLIKKREFNYY